MPEEEDHEMLAAELAALREEEAALRNRLLHLARLHQDATRARSQQETAAALGMTRREVRDLERRALLKAFRALAPLFGEHQP